MASQFNPGLMNPFINPNPDDYEYWYGAQDDYGYGGGFGPMGPDTPQQWPYGTLPDVGESLPPLPNVGYQDPYGVGSNGVPQAPVQAGGADYLPAETDAPAEVPEFEPGGSGRPRFAAPSFDLSHFKAPTLSPSMDFTLDPATGAIMSGGRAVLQRRPDFVGPTAETFQADPGYDFRLKEGTRALVNAKSADGLLRTGGTLKGLMEYAQNLASQEFGNVWNRAYTSYRTNLDADDQFYDNLLDTAATQRAKRAQEFDESTMSYDRNYRFEQDKFLRALSQHAAEAGDFDSEFGNYLNLFSLATRDLPQYTPAY